MYILNKYSFLNLVNLFIDLHGLTMYNKNTLKATGREGKKMEIKSILESLKDDVQNGSITIYQASVELFEAGWLNYIDTDKAKRLLKL